jgi:hypothetical protein
LAVVVVALRVEAAVAGMVEDLLHPDHPLQVALM